MVKNGSGKLNKVFNILQFVNICECVFEAENIAATSLKFEVVRPWKYDREKHFKICVSRFDCVFNVSIQI